MKKVMQGAFLTVLSLHEIKVEIIELFIKVKSERNAERIGYVSGIISSDGSEHIKSNIKKLNEYTVQLRKKYTFPIFSAADILSDLVYEKINGHTIAVEHWLLFWREILQSSHITDIFMTPRWDKSIGAIDEHEVAKKLKITIHYVKP